MRLFVVLHTGGALLLYTFYREKLLLVPQFWKHFYYEIRKQYNPVFISYLFFQINSLLKHRSTKTRPLPILLYFRIKWKESVDSDYDLWPCFITLLFSVLQHKLIEIHKQKQNDTPTSLCKKLCWALHLEENHELHVGRANSSTVELYFFSHSE